MSVEHERDWHSVVSQRLSPYQNAAVGLIDADAEPHAGYVSNKGKWTGRSFRDYVAAIESESGEFDLIIIDGRARAACLEHAGIRVAPGGAIRFDNSNRGRYRTAIEQSGMSASRLRD